MKMAATSPALKVATSMRDRHVRLLRSEIDIGKKDRDAR